MATVSNRITVLIRTRDIERHFQELLLSLSRQTLQPYELVVVDNFSSKSRLDDLVSLLSLAKKNLFNDRIQVKIAPLKDEEFSYPYSANVGVFASEHELVCMTNGHSLPISGKWLESGVTHFQSQYVAGVAGYTLPHKQGTTWEKIAYDWGWRRLNEVSRIYATDEFFSTVNCILRKSLWEQYPFNEKIPDEISNAGKYGGEDFDWALEMLARGYKIVVEPKLDVFHSHGETLSQLVPRYLVWRQIRRDIRLLKRPRSSYTRLKRLKPFIKII